MRPASTALISGLVWACWHYPILIWGDYNGASGDLFRLRLDAMNSARFCQSWWWGFAIYFWRRRNEWRPMDVVVPGNYA